MSLVPTRWYLSIRLLNKLTGAISKGFLLLIYILRFYIYRCSVIYHRIKRCFASHGAYLNIAYFNIAPVSFNYFALFLRT